MKEEVAPVSGARVSAGTLTALGLSSLDVVEEASNPFPIPLGLVSSCYCGLLAWR